MRHDIKSLMDLNPAEQSREARREISGMILASIRDIELQLGSKEKADADGKRLSTKAYLAWRRKAIKAMNHMTERYREYKRLEQAERQNEYAAKCATEEVATIAATGS